MARSKPLYLAISTINAKTNGYSIIAAGHNKQAVEDAAHNAISNSRHGDTYRSNLRVVSKTKARDFGVNWDAPYDMPPGWGANGEYEWVD